MLAADARSAVDLPPFPASAMDGFALRAADAPGTLPIVARIAAGRPAARALEAGEAMAISTGGVVPEGADASSRSRTSRRATTSSRFPAPLSTATTSAAAAATSAPGETVVVAGHAARPGARRRARGGRRRDRPLPPRPRVVVVVTGTELAAPGEPLGPGEIYDANGFILATQVRSAGAEVERLPPVKDDAEATRAAIERGLEADVLVTTGGVSVGVHDLVRAAEAELGVEEVFWRVAVRPGKPIAFGVRGRTLVFGLPGNPVSALVGFELFVRPALLALQGMQADRAGVPARAPRPCGAQDRRPRLAAARALPRRGRRGRARPAERPGVAHDRPGRDGRRARARSTWKRRARGRQPGQLPGSVAPLRARAAAAARATDGTLARTTARTGPARPLLAGAGIRRVPAGGRGGELRAGRDARRA